MTTGIGKFTVYLDKRCNSDLFILSQGTNIAPNGLPAMINIDLHDLFDFANTDKIFIKLISAEYTYNTKNQSDDYTGLIVSCREHIADSYNRYLPLNMGTSADYGKLVLSDTRFDELVTLPITGVMNYTSATYYFTNSYSLQFQNPQTFKVDQKNLTIQIFIDVPSSSLAYPQFPGLPYAFDDHGYIMLHFEAYK